MLANATLTRTRLISVLCRKGKVLLPLNGDNMASSMIPSTWMLYLTYDTSWNLPHCHSASITRKRFVAIHQLKMPLLPCQLYFWYRNSVPGSSRKKWSIVRLWVKTRKRNSLRSLWKISTQVRALLKYCLAPIGVPNTALSTQRRYPMRNTMYARLSVARVYPSRIV